MPVATEQAAFDPKARGHQSLPDKELIAKRQEALAKVLENSPSMVSILLADFGDSDVTEYFKKVAESWSIRTDSIPVHTLTRVVDTFPLFLPMEAAPGPTSETKFDLAFKKFGSWKGPFTSKAGTDSEIDFWRRAGQQGIYWLIGRTRTEHDNETLDSVATVLSSLGLPARKAIIRNLEAQPTVDQAICLLKAIRQSHLEVGRGYERIVHIMRRYLTHPDPDVREAAISATNALLAEDARNVLRGALRNENDPFLRDLIDDELKGRAAE
jgi:hypothetical protein